MKQAILVFVGGGLGSMLRYLVGKYSDRVQEVIPMVPLGTFFVNIIGSLLIGIILGIAARGNSLSQDHTLLLATGFCGGFTTFSAFAYENQVFLKNGDFLNFIIYTAGSIVLGILAVIAGLWLAKLL